MIDFKIQYKKLLQVAAATCLRTCQLVCACGNLFAHDVATCLRMQLQIPLLKYTPPRRVADVRDHRGDVPVHPPARRGPTSPPAQGVSWLERAVSKRTPRAPHARTAHEKRANVVPMPARGFHSPINTAVGGKAPVGCPAAPPPQ
jgi:hypothetical protein